MSDQLVNDYAKAVKARIQNRIEKLTGEVMAGGLPEATYREKVGQASGLKLAIGDLETCLKTHGEEESDG